MPNQTVDPFKRPGYSTYANLLKLRTHIAAGHLSKGDKVIISVLENFGIHSGEAYEVRIGLRNLGLIDSEDCITDTFVEVAPTTGEEYQKQLAKLLHYGYRDIFNHINPAHATQQELRDAFRDADYQPESMRSKMLSMFRALCREAGIITAETEKSRGASEQTISSQPQIEQVMKASTPLEGNAPMSELVLSSRNGRVPVQDHSMIDDILENLAQLRQLRKSPAWTETGREWWYGNLIHNAHSLIKAIEEERGRKQ